MGRLNGKRVRITQDIRAQVAGHEGPVCIPKGTLGNIMRRIEPCDVGGKEEVGLNVFIQSSPGFQGEVVIPISALELV